MVLWLVNGSNEDITVGPGELFGFNVGVFEEKPVGLVAGAKSCIPFLLGTDREPLVHLRQDTGKVLTTISGLAHWLTTTAGFTSMDVVDHTLSPLEHEVCASGWGQRPTVTI